MLHVELDVNWPEHPKILRVGLAGAGLHLVVLCLAAKSAHGTVPRADLLARGATDELIDRLIEERLIHDVGNDEVTPHSVYIGGLTRPWIPSAIRREVMDRDGWRCISCDTTDDLTLDHIVPYSHGGPDTVENLRAMCRSCNSRRGNRV